MNKLASLSDRALELAANVGDNLRQATPLAGKWLDTGLKAGALGGALKVAGRFARRHPALLAATAAAGGLLWYAAHRRAQQAENGANADGSIDGSARRIEPRRGNGRATPRARKAARSRSGDATE